jgi:hypothetical protein
MAATITNGRLNVVGLINKAKEAIRNLNLFQSIPPVQDASKLRKQLFSTRLFLLLFIISLITFTIYTSQVTIIRRVTTLRSVFTYIKLSLYYNLYSSKKISSIKCFISYSLFKQICSTTVDEFTE